MVDLFTIALGGILLGLLYWYGMSGKRAFEKMGVPTPPILPFIGNMIPIMAKGGCFAAIDFQKKYGKVYGNYFGFQPILMVHDLDMLKQVMIKDFNNFTDRWLLDTNPNPINYGMFFERGMNWRRLRNIVSPTFSGGKLRQISRQINECAALLSKNLLKKAELKEKVDVKGVFGAFTMDVIALTAFGLEVDSQNNPGDPFVSHARRIFSQSFLANPLIFLMFIFPSLQRLKVSAWPMDIVTFFVKVTQATMEERKKEKKNRLDFLQLLLDAEADNSEDIKQMKKRLTNDEIIGQAFLFFIAGYETTASTLSYLAHCLAMHPDVQERMLQEIQEELGEAEPDYENIGKLKYMEQVVNETLRIYPPVSTLTRLAAEPWDVGGLRVERDMAVGIPIYAVHHDPDIYPDPERFDPDRFTAEAKAARHPMAFMPFGGGPRTCIGMRLALVEMKMALVYVARAVRFLPPEGATEHVKVVDRGVLQPVEVDYLLVEAR